MRGCEPIPERMIPMVLSAFRGRWLLRDRALFVLRLYTGARISEALSLNLGDVVVGGRMPDRVKFKREHVKKKTRSRIVVLHPAAREAVRRWVEELKGLGYVRGDYPLFPSQLSGTPLSRQTAWANEKAAFARAGLVGQFATHSARKTFAKRAYDAVKGNIYKVREIMGHESVDSTASYVEFADGERDRVILNMGRQGRRSKTEGRRKTG